MNSEGVIRSFADALTEKIFNGDELNKKERKQCGDLNLKKAQSNLLVLGRATERELLMQPSLKYHHLAGTSRYSIDTVRNSKWRITFQWERDEMVNVELVKIEDTH